MGASARSFCNQLTHKQKHMKPKTNRIFEILLFGVLAFNLSSSYMIPSEDIEPQSRNSFHLEVLFPPILVKAANSTQLVYELHLTNFARDTLTLMNIQVIDEGSETVIAEFQGTALENVLGHLGSNQSEDKNRAVAPGARAIIYFNLPLHSVRNPGDELIHRIEFMVMKNGEQKHASVHGGLVEIAEYSLPELGPPLRGGPWVAVYNPSWEQGHRRVFHAMEGRATIQGRFAIDWMKAPEQPSATPGRDTKSNDLTGLGAAVLAVANALVVDVRNDMASPKNCAERTPLALEDYAGNYVVLELSDGHYAFYEHLQPGILVRPGDRVELGQVIGTLGCTGLASSPHLHFHTGITRSSFSEGLPHLLTNAVVLGIYNSMDNFRKGSAWQSSSVTGSDAFFPTPMMVVRFPEK